ncbi:MAG: CPBP family intramembrane metalloprotease [Kordiimonadaceae bacterium]|nr:CPBP family intramembrane metalloprotease [Kordiimonadaceae bacterium]
MPNLMFPKNHFINKFIANTRKLLVPSYLNIFFLGVISFALIAVTQDMVGFLVTVDGALRNDIGLTDLSLSKTFSLVVLDPLLETIIFQTGLIGIFHKLKLPVTVAINISAVIFSFSHFSLSLFSGIHLSINLALQALPLYLSGLLFAKIYVTSSQSLTLFWATMYTGAVHGVHNGIATLILMYLMLQG